MVKEFESYKNYVCPICFNQLHKCTCSDFPPYSLLFIDEKIQEHIKELNKKHFLTIGCCEGHYNSYSSEPYIAFGMDYSFNTLPNGFKWNKRRKMLLSKKIIADNIHDYEIVKNKRLEELMEWIKTL